MPEMRINQLKAPYRKSKKRVGRGIGSGLGKTSGRGHKGQRARSGGRRDGGYEGGQMPLHRRLPKRGFNSRLARITTQIRLSDLTKLEAEEITLAVLKEAGALKNGVIRAKIFYNGDIQKPLKIKGIPISAGAKRAVEAAGGSAV